MAAQPFLLPVNLMFNERVRLNTIALINSVIEVDRTHNPEDGVNPTKPPVTLTGGFLSTDLILRLSEEMR
jgi:hypothetical protein